MHMIASSLPVNMLAARRRTQEDIVSHGRGWSLRPLEGGGVCTCWLSHTCTHMSHTHNTLLLFVQLNTGDQFDPQEVGASIKALALSVQDTGMFGDLPKPRIDCRPYAR